MYKIGYTHEEELRIRLAVIDVVRDLEELWNIGALEKIEIPVNLKGIEKLDDLKDPSCVNDWNFVMDNDSIFIENDGNKLVFAQRFSTCEKMSIMQTSGGDVLFLKEYPKIREKIVESINKAVDEKKESLSVVGNIRRYCNRDAIIEIDMPPTNNQHKIEITKEDGRNVGVIDFGNRTIKIISDGDIVLVNRKEANKVLVK